MNNRYENDKEDYRPDTVEKDAPTMADQSLRAVIEEEAAALIDEMESSDSDGTIRKRDALMLEISPWVAALVAVGGVMIYQIMLLAVVHAKREVEINITFLQYNR